LKSYIKYLIQTEKRKRLLVSSRKVQNTESNEFLLIAENIKEKKDEFVTGFSLD